jgi:hypothetical protein
MSSEEDFAQWLSRLIIAANGMLRQCVRWQPTVLILTSNIPIPEGIIQSVVVHETGGG